ncbi:restriction endonuclease subunit S [Paenibacillus jamilae]|uniref:restriction endonuclease subunit S n=1 Tax=Paenibacillus TaxID=44249 RepID=UPI000E3DAACD|nr:restriction endonuclease subunit S [Paenibacillus jamilae]RFT99993.1 restriction endonuclease subunit S [Paenibacillus jamilae]
MDKEKLLPSLRFSGYSDTWERNKLEHYLNVSNEKNTEGIFGKEDVLSVSGDFGIINQIKFHGRSFAGVSTSNYGVVNTGDVVYTKSPLKANPFGIIKTNKGPNGIVSTLYAVYHPKENVYPDFIQAYFEQYARMNRYMHPLVNKGAKNDMKVSDANALKGDVVFPKVDEQKNIVKYFMNIDQLLTLHQKEYDKFLIMKKAMLDKMFPRKGMNVPEIRFMGFTEPWERRKVGEVTEELDQYTTLKSGFPLLTSSRSGLMMQNEYRDKTSTDNQDTLFSIVPMGACTYRHMSDDDIFHFNINEIVENGLVSREYPVFTASKDNNLFAIIQYLNSSPEFRAFCRKQKMGGTRTRLYYKSLCRFELLLPTEKEQDQIAAVLKHLDNLITLQQRKLEKLKNIKAGCLEKMFV